MQCEQISGLLAELVDADAFDRGVEAHVESCLRCQAELARYRRLLRGLAQLRTHYIEPVPGALADTLLAIETAAERTVVRSILSGRRLAVAGAGTAVAATAATAVVLLARSRRRSGLRLAG
jgi:anti-sigma factor RsiW